jgi:hypothetical protein
MIERDSIFWRIQRGVVKPVFLVLLLVFAAIIVPGLMSGKPLLGGPNSNALFRDGGFHCPGDGPHLIHYHTCSGAPVALPKGRSPSDFPTVR